VEIYSTADVPRGTRAAYWSQVYSRRFAPIAMLHSDEGGRFKAELKVGALASVEFACVRSCATAVERGPTLDRDRMIGFVMIVSGSGVASHCGQETWLESGDLLLTDSTETVRTRFDTPIEGITVRAPASALRARLPHVDLLCGRRLPAGTALADTAISMAKSLSGKLDDALPLGCAEMASGHLLDLIASSFGLAYESPLEEAPLAAARRARVNAFIEEHLSDPELSPARVAEALRISPRYLRKLMAEQGETASSMILRRRLEECARTLQSDMRHARSITDVAFSWGFNSTAHFSRTFKSKYGVSPRDYRPAAAAAL
jgi:AraC-like DNA-binding protein